VNGVPASLREPSGERALRLPACVGSDPADDVRVPGAAPGEALRLEWRDGATWACAARDLPVRLNGEALGATARELRPGDLVAIGSARLRVGHTGAAAPVFELRHLAGNDTIAPLGATRLRATEEDGGDADIVAATIDLATPEARAADPERARAAASRRRTLGWGLAVAALALLLAFGVLGRLQRVTIDVQPATARVSASGLVSWRSGGTLFALPGERTLRATLEGYAPLERRITLVPDRPERVVLRLAKLPGVLEVDTGGVVASVTVDGAPAGRVPGELKVAAGERTLTFRAERHFDLIQRVTVEGMGARQALQLRFEPSWGRLELSASTPGAALSIDGGAAVPLPAVVDLPAGVHRIAVDAAGARSWASSVLVNAGETTRIGPLTLGAPDATLALRSRPAGAEVTVGGVFRGRTPLELALPPGMPHDLLVTRAGHRPWQQRVEPAAGSRLALLANLEPIPVQLTVAGEPADAELFIDGVPRGRTPASVELLATRYAIEVRKAGLQAFREEVDLTPALARRLEYALQPEGRAAGWKPPSETLTTRAGQVLRLVPAGTFMMGSDRREQGRQPNETQRVVTLTRRFYLGTREVTNAEFRRFRPGHASGFVDKRSIDLDGQAVTGVSWADAVQYCNWLSEQEGLAPAYEQKDGRWLLRTPVGTGYRLPTEAEWEFAARFGGAGRPQRRYEWGDALPPPAGSANLAGAEAVAALERVLDGWRDEDPAVAPTGRHAPSALGLLDMTGNVSEWVHDVYASFAEPGANTDPTGPVPGAQNAARRVIKGSSWRTASYAALRPAWRDGRDGAANDIGFRIARYPDE
jgi:formylglycine-generating enzyme required for sulfatase activity